MLAYKLADLSRDLAASAADADRVRLIAATLQGYASQLRDQELAVVPPRLRGADRAGVVVLSERRAVR